MLLSESELRAALEPLLDRLLAERLRVFGLQQEARLQSRLQASLAGQHPSAEIESALRSLLAAQDPNQSFAALFQAVVPWTGAKRALLVVRDDEAVVWKNTGLTLPPRFPLASQPPALRASKCRALQVRGRQIGLLAWQSETDADCASVEMLIQVAELALFSQALPQRQSKTDPAGASPSPAPARAGDSTPDATPEDRFARLLLTDLRLYLELERPSELAASLAAGDSATRFAAELARCRQAFAARFPGEQRNFSDLPG